MHKKQKNQSWLRADFFKAQILRALLSNKMEFCIFDKVNNSIATKLCANLLNNREKNKNSALHNSMTKLCCAPFKCKNKMKFVKKINAKLFSALKWELV